MSFQPSVGYQLEQLRKAGNSDEFHYLAVTTFDSLVAELLADGYSEDELDDLLRNAIENYEPEEDDDES
jgi:hypothetical protein